MSYFPDTYNTANGPMSFWTLHIPTTAPEGLHVAVRLYHDEAIIEATLADSTGTWSKTFYSPEELDSWVYSIARGTPLRVDNQKPASHFIRVAA